MKSRLCVLALLLAASILDCESVTAQTVSDLTRLQGHWEGSGPGGECSITISGNSLYFKAREDFWYETTFTLPAGTDPQQLHATIDQDSTGRQDDVGRVVVAVFRIEGDALTLAVIDDFDGPLTEPVVTASDWAAIEANWTLDRYHLKRVGEAPPQ